jgi:hypothetical protein
MTASIDRGLTTFSGTAERGLCPLNQPTIAEASFYGVKNRMEL